MAQQTYTTILNAVALAVQNVITTTSPPYASSVSIPFNVIFPQAISYAENRIWHDIVPLANRTQNTSLTTTANSRAINLNHMTNSGGTQCLTVEGVALIGPAGTTNPALGTRIPFTQTSLDWIDQVWPVEATTMAPSAADWVGRYWALRDAFTIVLAPTPDSPGAAVYTAEITGQFQPTTLSSTTATTYLSTYYPELLEAAIMVWMTGWLLRNWGAQSDDPKMAQSYENQYQLLMKGALEEEQRRRGSGVGWTNFPITEAQPARA